MDDQGKLAALQRHFRLAVGRVLIVAGKSAERLRWACPLVARRQGFTLSLRRLQLDFADFLAEVRVPVAAVDATGAGDAFNGALAAGLVDGRPLEEAVRRAVVAAGLATTRSGAREGMPTSGELDAALGAAARV